jgi:hypothetical protein
MYVAVHLSCPLQKSPQIATFPPGKLPELQYADLLHLHACVSFDTPQ